MPTMRSKIHPVVPAESRRAFRGGGVFRSALVAAWLFALPLVGVAAEFWPRAGSAHTGPALTPSGLPVSNPPPPGTQRRLANFLGEAASDEVRHVAHWAVDSGNNTGMPYLVIDKVDAKVYAFDATGRLKDVQPALLGLGRGDYSAPGIGSKKMTAIPREDRTTPAGRFVATLGRDPQGKEILWVDYETAVALHSVSRGTPVEQRAQRLRSATPDDNRISYGCINVPVRFYDEIVSPAFNRSGGIVYILPEQSTAREFFGSYDVEAETL